MAYTVIVDTTHYIISGGQVHTFNEFRHAMVDQNIKYGYDWDYEMYLL